MPPQTAVRPISHDRGSFAPIGGARGKRAQILLAADTRASDEEIARSVKGRQAARPGEGAALRHAHLMKNVGVADGARSRKKPNANSAIPRLSISIP
jgi:hypothetical protein